MVKRYSFLNHPFYFVLTNANQMVAGINKVVAIFYNHTKKQQEALEFSNKLKHIEVFDVNYITELRKAKEKYNWINNSQVPFEVSESEYGQLTFDDEKNNSVLELRFKNKHDNQYDVLYFFFNSNIGNFKLANIDESMAVVVKEVIQQLLHRQINLIIQENEVNTSIHHKISTSFSHIDMQYEVERIKKEKFNQSKATFQYILNKLISQEAFEMSFSSSAVEKIISLNLDLEDVEQLLLNSLEVIVNKYQVFNFYEIKASDIVVNFNAIKEPKISIKQEQLVKTAKFLDKYEASAKLLKSKNEKITGLNIGSNCYPDVSPAAISDVLKKHSKKIEVLLTTYPYKWKIIREEFKPLRNILEKKHSTNQSRLGA